MRRLNIRSIRELSQMAEEFGFKLEGPTNGGHLRWRDRQGNTVITATSPSDHRAAKNTRSIMRRVWRQTQERA